MESSGYRPLGGARCAIQGGEEEEEEEEEEDAYGIDLEDCNDDDDDDSDRSFDGESTVGRCRILS